jgi:uncharacterized protein (TIGR02677 family)
VRHLRINEETLNAREESSEGNRTSWLSAAPMWLEPQLRKSGRAAPRGRSPELLDLSSERELLRRQAAEENAQIARAHQQLATGEQLALSDFDELEPLSFHLLLDLLGRAVASSKFCEKDEFPVTANSIDGSLTIELYPEEPDSPEAEIATTTGVITGPDYRVRITGNFATQQSAA